MNIGHKTLSTPHTQNTVASPELHQALVIDLHKLRVNLEKKKLAIILIIILPKF